MFIKNGPGYINLDVVARGSLGQIERGRSIPTGYFSPTGAEIDRVGELPDLEKLTAPLLPAGPITTMVCITPTGEVTAAPIAGWRVCRSGLEPLFVIEPPAGATRFLAVGAHGLVKVDDGTIFPDLAAARKFVTDASHPSEAPAVVEAEPTPVEQPKTAAAGRRRG
jgi:hypothetical protein